MAERRMFAKTIVLSDAFLDMPMTARCLYFTLGMLADDDGFVNAPRSIMRQCGASDDDMKVLISKKFVLVFESGVIVIKHWRINNYLQKDRYRETKYVEEKKQLSVDEKGGYHRAGLPPPDDEEDEEEEIGNSAELRKAAYAESNLPYCFDYKIRMAFSDKPCPVCGYPMRNYKNGIHRPTIQHNLPISKGGKHELSNISVICHDCNVSIRDKQTGPLNNEEVISEWARISGDQPDVYTGMYTQDRLGKDRGRLEEESIVQDNNSFSLSLKEKEEEKEIPLSDEHAERVLHFARMVNVFKSRGFDASGAYALATTEGITREEIDAARAAEKADEST